MVAIGALTKLLQQYEELKQDLTPTEFVEIKRAEKSLPNDVAKEFLVLVRHYVFLEQVTKDFVDFYKVRRYSKMFIMVLIYTIVFHIKEDDYEHWFSVLTKWKDSNLFMLLQYFSDEGNLTQVAMAGCRVFCNSYVITEIIRPLITRIKFMKRLYDDLVISLSMKSNRSSLSAKGPTLLYRRRHNPPPPVNTPVETQFFKSREVPYESYYENETIQRNLRRTFETNRKHARKLFQLTQQEAFACAIIKVSDSREKNTPKPVFFKSKKPPPKRDVGIKTNAATIMREAALLVRKEEQEIQKLESLMQGGRDDYKISTLEAEVRKTMEEERIKDIERKHLIGQLTYEEAILAKKKQLKENKEKAVQFKEERNKLLEEIERWRLEEQQKIKTCIKMGQFSDKSAKEAHERLLEKRQRSAKLFKVEHRKLLDQAFCQKQEELKQKVKLIQELRALQQVKNLQVYTKEYDPTETQNLGLLCEMSIAELQERLGLLKLEMQQLLEEKHRKVVDMKEKKTKFLEEAKDFINTAKLQSKVFSHPIVTVKPNIESIEITELREKLQRAREMRLADV